MFTTRRRPHASRGHARRGREGLLILALLALFLTIGLISSRPRTAVDPPGEYQAVVEHEPPPSPLVAPRPPAIDAPPPIVASRARVDPTRAEEAGRVASPTRPASTNARESAALEVRVLAGGRAAPLAWIELGHTPRGSEQERVELHRTDADGRLALELSPGAVRAVAWDERATALPARAELAAGEHASLALALEPASTVAGRVIDAQSGQPVPAAEVSFWTFAERDVVRTLADGTFVHPRFPAGTPAQQVSVRARGYGPAVRYLKLGRDGRWKLPGATEGETDLDGQGRPWIEIALVPALSVRGRVVDGRGQAIAGASASAEGFFRVLPSVASRDGAAAATDDGGWFTLEGLRSDIGHSLRVAAPGLAARSLEIAADGAREVDLGSIVLERESVLAGAVVDGEGFPAEDLEVLLIPSADEPEASGPEPRSALDVAERIQGRELRARTSAAGAFLFEHLEPRALRLIVRRDRGALVETEVFPRADGTFGDVALALPLGSLVLEGLARDEQGRVLAGARIELRRSGPVGCTTTDREGRFRIAGLDDAAAYEISAFFRDDESGALLCGTASVWAYERPALALSLVQPELAQR